MSRGDLIGAMCPICLTVQNWKGEHIFSARIFCRGDVHVGSHETTTVVPVFTGCVTEGGTLVP